MTTIADEDLTAEDVAEPDDIAPPPVRDLDAISLAIGSGGFVAEYVLDACVERFDGNFWREPDTFDRFYWGFIGDTLGLAPVLVDVLMTDTVAQQADERAAKHCEFKASWCRDNGHAYVVLVEAECQDSRSVAEAIRASLAWPDQADVPALASQEPARRGPGRPRKGSQGSSIQRPRED